MKGRALGYWAGLLWIVAFGATCSSSSQKASLTIWETYNDEEHSVFMEVVRRFESTHPGVTIKVQRIPFQGMEQKLLTAIAAGMPPDLARVDNAFTAVLAAKKAVVPIFPHELGDLPDHLLQAPLASNLIHDTLFGLPDQATCVILLYRKDLFQKYGISEPPRTWEEFVKIGKRLTHPDQGIYAFGMRNSLWWTFPFFYSFGAGFLSKDLRSCLFDEPAAIQAFRFKVDLYRKYKIEAGAWKSGAIPPDVGFRNGKYAMIFSGPWALKSLESAGIDFGLALVPAGPAGSHTTIGGTNMVILNPKRKALALSFLKFLLSPEIQAYWANELGQIPLNREALAQVDTLQHPYLPLLMRAMETAIARPAIPFYSQIELLTNAEMELALQGKKTPEQAMRDADRRIEEEILRKQTRP